MTNSFREKYLKYFYFIPFLVNIVIILVYLIRGEEALLFITFMALLGNTSFGLLAYIFSTIFFPKEKGE